MGSIGIEHNEVQMHLLLEARVMHHQLHALHLLPTPAIPRGYIWTLTSLQY